MKTQAADQHDREVFILRIWPKPFQGTWTVEIQNVITKKVIHLHDLDAIADCLRAELITPPDCEDELRN